VFVSGGEINVTNEHIEFKPVETNIYYPGGDIKGKSPLSFKTSLSDYGVFLFKRSLLKAAFGFKNQIENFNSGVKFFVSGHIRGIKIKLYREGAGSSFIVTREKAIALREALSATRFFSTELSLPDGNVLLLKERNDGLNIFYTKNGKSATLDLASLIYFKKMVWKAIRNEYASYEYFGELSIRITPDRKLWVNNTSVFLTKERALELLCMK